MSESPVTSSVESKMKNSLLLGSIQSSHQMIASSSFTTFLSAAFWPWGIYGSLLPSMHSAHNSISLLLISMHHHLSYQISCPILWPSYISLGLLLCGHLYILLLHPLVPTSPTRWPIWLSEQRALSVVITRPPIYRCNLLRKDFGIRPFVPEWPFWLFSCRYI